MRQNDFENTPMLKLVMSLAIPSMIAQLVNILYSIVDRIHCRSYVCRAN